ncbi:MAG: type II secretion system F family protein [Planctomycetota bacterium]
MSPHLRARLLARLSRLVDHGVPLTEGLAALEAEEGALRRGRSAAAEGAALDTVLGATPLVAPGDLELLRACRDEPAEGLALVAEEAQARAEMAEALTDLLMRPLWKALAILLLGGAFGAVAFGVGAGWISNDPVQAEYGLLLAISYQVVWSLCLFAAVWLVVGSRLGRRALEALGRRLVIAGPLLGYETRARFLGALGTGLSAGLTLGAALQRAREAFAGRPTADVIADLEDRAREGARLSALARAAPFLDASSVWLIEAAVERPDLPGELRELAALERRRLVHEAARWSPLLAAAAEVTVLSILGGIVIANASLSEVFRYM